MRLSAKRTDEGQPCRYSPFVFDCGKAAPHPALRGHLPPWGKARNFNCLAYSPILEYNIHKSANLHPGGVTMQYKVLALDLDGTLTNSDKIITPRTKAALQAALYTSFL
mgnify:FL=1